LKSREWNYYSCLNLRMTLHVQVFFILLHSSYFGPTHVMKIASMPLTE
jgi:hypothetical protein